MKPEEIVRVCRERAELAERARVGGFRDRARDEDATFMPALLAYIERAGKVEGLLREARDKLDEPANDYARDRDLVARIDALLAEDR